MSIRTYALIFSTAVMATFGGGVANAQTLIGQGGFSSGQTLGGFNSNDYAGSGVMFSGALPGMSNVGDTNLFAGNGAYVVAGNRPDSLSNSLVLSYSAPPAGPQTGVGFGREIWPQQTLHSGLFNGVNDLGGTDFHTHSPAPSVFVGFREFTAFDRKAFTNTVDNNEPFTFDNSELENVESDIFEVPVLLALLGLVGVGLAIAVYRRFKAA